MGRNDRFQPRVLSLSSVVMVAVLLAAWSSVVTEAASRGRLRSVSAEEPVMPADPYAFCDSLLDQLMRFFPAAVQSAKLAVFPLVNETEDPSIVGGTWIAERFTKVLRDDGRFVLVDRNQFRRALRDYDLTVRDEIDDGMATDLSRTLGVGYMLVGSVRQSPSKGYVVEARIVDVSSGVISTGASKSATAEQMYFVEKDLLTKRSQTAIQPALLRSLLMPGWGQFYRKRFLAGSIPMAGFVAAVGVGVAFAVPAGQAWSDYRTFRDEGAGTSGLSQDELTQYTRTGDSLNAVFKDKLTPFGITVGVGAVIWALNITDVVVSGRRKARSYRLYFTGDFKDEYGIGVCLSF